MCFWLPVCQQKNFNGHTHRDITIAQLTQHTHTHMNFHTADGWNPANQLIVRSSDYLQGFIQLRRFFFPDFWSLNSIHPWAQNVGSPFRVYIIWPAAVIHCNPWNSRQMQSEPRWKKTAKGGFLLLGRRNTCRDESYTNHYYFCWYVNTLTPNLRF